MLSRALFFLALPFSLLLSAFFLAPFAHAESVQDSQVIQHTLARYNGNSCTEFMAPGTLVNVSYNVSAINADAGTPVCNSSVTVGTRLKFEFLPHVPEDIVWGATGYFAATPYGSWAINGDYSPWTSGKTNRCEATNFYHTAYNTHYGYLNLFAALVISTPTKDISIGNNLSCGTPDANGNVVCIAQKAGSGVMRFNIHGTTGYFYPGMIDMVPQPMTSGQCNGNPSSNSYPPMWRTARDLFDPNTTVTASPCYGTGPYVVAVQPHTIDCPVTVTEPVGNPPATPQLTSAGSCTVGSPHTINFVSTDPDGNSIRYGIDWDADGSVNEWMPSSGYVSSGSSQTASRVYAVAATKTVKVLAQDTNGLSSPWATISFNCAGSSSGTGDDSGSLSGLSGTGDADVGGAQSPIPVLSLRVVPSLVNRGETTQVHWSTENLVSCTVTGQNGDSWSGLESPLGGESSQPIMSRTVYTLSCRDADGSTHTKIAWVGIAPNWRER